MKQIDVVVIDDNEGICWVFRQALALCKLNCLTLSDGTQGLEQVIRHRPGLVIIDIKLGAMNGFEVARRIRQNNIDAKILFVTGYSEAIAAEEWGGDKNILGVLEKPFNVEEFLEMVAEIFDRPLC
ncbi:MAG: response regulator [Firmicutes bacterium]|nr:response regulator [Bacillota bacterium]